MRNNDESVETPDAPECWADETPEDIQESLRRLYASHTPPKPVPKETGKEDDESGD